MSHTVETRDPYTASYERRASVPVRSITREISLSKAIANIVHMADSIHNSGKALFTVIILSKPSVPSEIEMNPVNIRPQARYNILQGHWRRLNE